MTQDYKEKIFNFISGHYNIEQPANNEPYYVLETNDTGSLKTQIADKINEIYGLTSYDLTIYNSIQSGTLDNEGYEYIVAWGLIHKDSPLTNHFFIMVVDSAFNLVAFYTQYSSGTDINNIIDLQMAEDGTFYAIETTGTGFRYAQYNNFCLPFNGEYILKLRDAANISNDNLTMNGNQCNPYKIKKMYGTATYAIACFGGLLSNNGLGTLFLTIEGGSNTWNKAPYGSNLSSGTILDAYSSYGTNGQYTNYYNKIIYKNGSTGEISLFMSNILEEMGLKTTSLLTTATPSGTSSSKGMFVNFNDAYIVSNKTNGNVYLEGFDVLGNFNTYDNIQLSGVNSAFNIYMKYNKGELFTFFEIPKNTYYADVYVGRIWNNKLYYQQFMGENNIMRINTTSAQGFYFVNNNFNLSKIGLYAFSVSVPGSPNDQLEYLTQIFNTDNYNGVVPYQDLTSLNPTQAILENAGGDILFARNLYSNVYSGGNKIVSTLEIPSRYINGVNIDSNILYGFTNNEIVYESKMWSKTEYEDVFVNFINFYQVVDKTQTNPKYMTTSSNQVSNYIYNNTTGYGNIDIKRYRLNYADGTSSTHLLTLNYDGVNEVLGIQLSFLQDENHKVNSIDILSKDETIAYITIDTRDYEENKIHTITMNMHIE